MDGPNASRITPAALDRWEERLEALFDGRPYDALDAALTDTVARFPVEIQPFREPSIPSLLLRLLAWPRLMAAALPPHAALPSSLDHNCRRHDWRDAHGPVQVAVRVVR